jgi:hypothetical protein
VFVPMNCSTPVATWFWKMEGRSAEHVILGVRPSEFILLEFQSPSRRIFIGPHLLPLSGRLIGPSTSGTIHAGFGPSPAGDSCLPFTNSSSDSRVTVDRGHAKGSSTCIGAVEEEDGERERCVGKEITGGFKAAGRATRNEMNTRDMCEWQRYGSLPPAPS